jgi:hypothetical protein
MRSVTYVLRLLIFQTMSAGFGTLFSCLLRAASCQLFANCYPLPANRLPRFHRAGPSTSLDECYSTIGGVYHIG